MLTSMDVTIFVNDTHRSFKADYDTLHNNDWNEIIRDLLDTTNIWNQNYQPRASSLS